jgi:hypothetical protein
MIFTLRRTRTSLKTHRVLSWDWSCMITLFPFLLKMSDDVDTLRKLTCDLQCMDCNIIRKWLHRFFEISVGIGAAKTLTKPGVVSVRAKSARRAARLLRMTMRRSRQWPCSPDFHQRTAVCSFVGMAPLIGPRQGHFRKASKAILLEYLYWK